MQFLDRAKWGASKPKWRESIAVSVGMFIHYNGGTPLPGNVVAGDYNAVAGHLRGVQSYHMNTNGWPDVAYSWCVDATGRIWELRGWGIAGAHTLNWNWNSHAIYLPLGGSQAPTPEQIAACKTVIAEHNRRYGVGFVKGHQQAPNSTSCPGPTVMALINAGAFNPGASAPAPQPNPAPTQVPQPQGVDLKMNKPTMMQEPDGTVWMYYSGTPFRVHVKSPADVNAFKYMGVEYKVVDAGQAAFFRRYSQEVKCG